MPILPGNATRRASRGPVFPSAEGRPARRKLLTPEADRDRQGLLKREFGGLTGFVTGIAKGIAAIARNPSMLVTTLPGEIAKSMGRTLTAQNLGRAARGETTWTEAILEDLGNVAAVFSLGATAAGAGAGLLAKTGSTASAASLAKASHFFGQAATPIRTGLVRPLARAGSKSLLAAAEGSVGRGSRLLGRVGGIAERVGHRSRRLIPAQRAVRAAGHEIQELVTTHEATIKRIDQALEAGEITGEQAVLAFKDLGFTTDDLVAAAARQHGFSTRALQDTPGAPPGTWRDSPHMQYSGKLPTGAPNTHGVELVDIDELRRYREFDRASSPKPGGRSVESLAESIQKNGLDEPVLLTYDPQTGRALLSEGNTRLAALEALGYRKVPTRVDLGTVPRGVGATPHGKAAVYPDEFGWLPHDMAPSWIGIASDTPSFAGPFVDASQSALPGLGPEPGSHLLPTVRVPAGSAARAARTIADTIDTLADDIAKFQLDPNVVRAHLEEIAPISVIASKFLRERMHIEPPPNLTSIVDEIHARMTEEGRFKQSEKFRKGIEKRGPVRKTLLGTGPDVLSNQAQAWVDTVERVVANHAITGMMDGMYRDGIVRTLSATADVPKGWVEVKPDTLRQTRFSGGSPGTIQSLDPNTVPSMIEEAMKKADAAGDHIKIIMPEQVARGMAPWTDQSALLSRINLGQGPLELFRSAVLYHSPRWLRNNLVGNIFTSAVTGALFNPASVVAAWRQAKKSGKIRIGANITLRQSERSLLRTATGRGAAALGVRFPGVHRGVAGGGVTSESAALASGIAGTRFAKWSREMNEVTDGFFRTLVYHTELKRAVKAKRLEDLRNGTFTDDGLPEDFANHVFEKTQRGEGLTQQENEIVTRAVEAANKGMVDYGNLNPIERHIIRQIIPFYTWQKGILKLAFSMPFDHPLRFAVLENISNHLGGFSEEERQKYPQWMWGLATLPLIGTTSLRGLNPFQDAMQLATVDGINDSLSPVFDIPLDLLIPSRSKPGIFFGPTEVGPIGKLQPQVGLDDVAIDFLRGLPPMRAAREANLNPFGLLGPSPENLAALGGTTSAEQSPVRRGLTSLVGFRTFGPEELARRQRQEREARLTAYQSILDQRKFEKRRRLGLTAAAGGRLLP